MNADDNNGTAPRGEAVTNRVLIPKNQTTMKKEIINKQGHKLTLESNGGVLAVTLDNGQGVARFDMPNTQCEAFFESVHAVTADAARQPLTDEQKAAISERWGTGEDKQPF